MTVRVACQSIRKLPMCADGSLSLNAPALAIVSVAARQPCKELSTVWAANQGFESTTPHLELLRLRRSYISAV